MRERGGGLTLLWAVTVMVVLVKLKGAMAIPAAVPTHHQPSSSSMEANHVEDEHLDDALSEWLNNFDTYTFMVKQDLAPHGGDAEGGQGGKGGEKDYTGAAVEEAAEGEEEEEEEEDDSEESEEAWSAPIAVSTGSKSLLDPRQDYLVTVESLVAEEGSIFLTLSRYDNQTECGVGGLTVEVGLRDPPRAADDQEGETTPPDTSGWVEVSEDYWWARGRLSGGAMLSITFTPPECGCLALSTYYALPVGNLTLVVGPQAYPDELQVLLCIDPLATIPEDEEAVTDLDYIQEPGALVASKNPGEDQSDAETEEYSEEPAAVLRKRKLSRGVKGAKTPRRLMQRQWIRQAGRRQARKQQQQQQHQGRRSVRRANRRRKKKKTAKKGWKKVKKGIGRRRRYRKKHHHHEDHENVNGTDTDNTTAINGTNVENVTAEDMTQHHHHHHHLLAGLNVSMADQHEERLMDILLRDPPGGNSTTEEDQGRSAAEETDGAGEDPGGEKEEEEEEEAMTPRQRRKKWRQRKKFLRKERKNDYPPGVKFCCKQGVKHKKNILGFDSTSENAPESCNATNYVVNTFANHQFGIEAGACNNTYTKCCTRFTVELWNSIKARKMARRIEKQQRRKSRRKQRRRNDRRMRKEMKKQADQQDVGEEATAMDSGCVAEGDDACEPTK